MQMTTKPGDLIVTPGTLSRFLSDDRESWMTMHGTYHACLPFRMHLPVSGCLTEQLPACRAVLVTDDSGKEAIVTCHLCS